MVDRLSNEAVKVVRSVIGKKSIGRNVSNRAVFEKGIVKAKIGGGSSFNWQLIKDPTNPNLSQENYQLNIDPRYNKAGDMTHYRIDASVEATKIPRPLESKVIEGLSKTRNFCSVGFLSADNMRVECSYYQDIPLGRFEDWLENKNDMIQGVDRIVSRARGRIYSNF